MKEIVKAQTERHLELLQEGWKPDLAWETFEHIVRHHRSAAVTITKDDLTLRLPALEGEIHDVKPISEVMVLMVSPQ